MKRPRRRPNYPKAVYIARVVGLLNLFKLDKPYQASWRTSQAGIPNLRLEFTINEVPVELDIYAGSYHCIRIGNRTIEVCNSLPEIANYLVRTLQLTPSNN